MCNKNQSRSEFEKLFIGKRNEEYNRKSVIRQKELEEDVPVESESKYSKTEREFMDAMLLCRDIFIKKLADYGPSWRVFRPQSVTDQIYIKACRIRNIEEGAEQQISDDALSEFKAIVNYGIIGLIQLQLGRTQGSYDDMSNDDALENYDYYMREAFTLMTKKNNDYAEAWRLMRINSYTDFIHVKLCRVFQMEAAATGPKNSEGIDSNYLDIINYAIFAIIKLTA